MLLWTSIGVALLDRLKMRCSSKIFSTLLCRRYCSRNQDNLFHVSVYNALTQKRAGTKVAVKGWVKAMRIMKNNVFFDIDDGSSVTKLQIVLPTSEKPHELAFGSAVKVEGTLTANPNNRGNSELIADKVEVVGPCDVSNGYPFAPRKVFTSDYMRQFLHFRSRTTSFSSLLRIRSAASLAVHNYFNSKGFIQIHAPILTSNDCEGAGEVFGVTPHRKSLLQEMSKEGLPEDEAFFDCKAFLTVSGQLHAECMARGISKVYTFGPTFRAENSRTRLHLSEFYMIEPEVAFVDSLSDILHLIEEFVKHVTHSLLDSNSEDIDFFYRNHNSKLMEYMENILSNQFAIMTYDEAFEVICGNAGKLRTLPRKEIGLNKEQELFLVEKNGGCPVFVINWPKEMKPFYMKELDENPSMVSAVDLLAPRVGELCGGSLRETDPCKLTKRLHRLHLEQQLNWYIELRRFGNVPTGGFGMGFERFLQMLLPIPSIKDVIPFPRWPHNCQM